MAFPYPLEEGGGLDAQQPALGHRVESHSRASPGRAELEDFIGNSFFATYGAHVGHFCETLVACRDAGGALIAALGYSPADAGPTFLEQYLDAPLEVEIGRRLGRPVTRSQVVEVGNLAAIRPGAARILIVRTTRLLYRMGLHWVAFTATASVLNSFGRLHLQPQPLAAADPSRLPDGGRQWGSYYDTQPHVMFGDIHYGYAQLAQFSSSQRQLAE